MILSNLSWIQRHILVELTAHGPRRYSQLRPSDVEGNLFTYHLKGLLTEGIVEKTEDKRYTLSDKGLRLVATMSLQTGKARAQPQILNAIVARNDQGEFLLSRWRRQPNMGLVSLPHGMMHYGQSLYDMAAQELAEKTGMTADLSYRGEVIIRTIKAGEVERHMLVHIFAASNLRPDRQEVLRKDTSESFWADISTLSYDEFIPGFYELMQLTQERTSGHIFADLAIDAATPPAKEAASGR